MLNFINKTDFRSLDETKTSFQWVTSWDDFYRTLERFFEIYVKFYVFDGDLILPRAILDFKILLERARLGQTLCLYYL